MWTAPLLGSRALGLIPLLAPAVHPATLPPVGELEAWMGFPARVVSVYEPHLVAADGDVEVGYVGYRAIDVIARLLGEDWRSRAATVEFSAIDGYVALVDAARFDGESAFVVFARADGAPFTVDNVAQNETDVPLGPYYLVWDNVSNPALRAEGARYWPYQVTDVSLVTAPDAALLPTGLDPRFHEGAELARTHCLSCHEINGVGGSKFGGNLAGVVKGYPEGRFLQLLLTPAVERPGATMPGLPEELPEPERRRIADAVFEYLVNLPVLP